MALLVSRQEAMDLNAKVKLGKDRLKEVKSLSFDLSFTSQDFKNMDLTKVDGGHEVRKRSTMKKEEKQPWIKATTKSFRVPKLRFQKLKSLIMLVKDCQISASAIKDLLNNPAFAKDIFEIMDVNGDGMLDTWELMKSRPTQHEASQEELAFKSHFELLIKTFSGGYDVITQNVFDKIWSGKDLDQLLISALDGPNLTSDSVLEFIIRFTNPRYTM